jgi:hypothetical protein
MSTSEGLSRQIMRFTKSPYAPTSLIIKSIAPLNPEINLEKYEHPCPVENLNPGGHVPLRGTQPADL